MLNPVVLWFGLNVLSAVVAVVAAQFLRGTWQKLLSISCATLPMIAFIVVRSSLAFWIVPVMLFSIVLFVNPLRLAFSKYSEKRKSHQVSKDSVSILWLLCLFFAVLVALELMGVAESIVLAALMLIGAIFNVVLGARGFMRLKQWKYKSNDETPEAELPTVTLAIPARNEDHALTACLEKAVETAYPKLEILVLDDCSQDRTAQIIRSFAHNGVRFVQGEQPDDSWLGKNYALNLLAGEASGDIIIFSGVDVHFKPESISRLVSTLRSNNLKMLSVLPRRDHLDFASTLLQPLRYLKNLLLSSNSRPATLSTCWAIEAKALKELGGLSSAKGSVTPERTFARALNYKGSYRFLISDKGLAITTRKRFSSQIETATRTLYPRLERNLLNYFLWNLAVIWLGVMPFMVLAVYGATGITGLSALAGVASLLVVNTALMVRIHPLSWWLGIVQLPIAIVLELAVTLWSLYKYEFSDVRWKGRNVCVPVYKSA